MKVVIKEDNGRRVFIGEVFPEESSFKKRVKKSMHLLKKLDAWGIDAKYFTAVLLPNNYEIIIYDTDDHKHYYTDAETFKKKGEYRHYKPHRAQIFLSRRDFYQSP